MNKVYSPSHDPLSGWTIRHSHTGHPDGQYTHRFDYPFYARFVSVFVAYHQGVGLNEVILLGTGKDRPGQANLCHFSQSIKE